MSEVLLYTGIAVCAVSILGAVIAAIGLHIAQKHLTQRLDEEYGKRRH